MAINRVLYATQTARLHVPITSTGVVSSTPWILAVQTASADETIPQDDVLVLGKLGGAARLQKDVATSKASLKAFLVDSMVGQGSASANKGIVADLGATVQGGAGSSDGNSQLLATIENASLLGQPCTLIVDSTQGSSSSAANDGFSMSGIVSNISIDGSKGAFPSLDLSFEGVGRLNTLNMGATATLAGQHGGNISIKTVVPLTSRHVEVSGATNDTVASVKFSYDMPTETLSALGGNIIGNSIAVQADNKMFAKPPFKASMNADGQGLAGVASSWGSTCYVNFKHHTPSATHGLAVHISSDGLNVSTRSFSQNVGDVGATFSVAAEGTDVSFYDI